MSPAVSSPVYPAGLGASDSFGFDLGGSGLGSGLDGGVSGDLEPPQGSLNFPPEL